MMKRSTATQADAEPVPADESWREPVSRSSHGVIGNSHSADEAVMQVVDVVKEYPSTPPVRAVDGMSFTIGGGELVAIVGPSGSGKSTLLHLMGTLDRPTEGIVEVAGHRVDRLSDRQLSALRARHIGFVFQQFYLLSGYTALDNVADGLLYSGAPLRDRRERAADALDRVGLAHRVDHLSSKLSGGERQRVAIARALVGEPSIVLADEPTGNLDSASSDAIIDLLRGLNREGTTIVVISHDRDLAGSLPREIAVRDGQIEHDLPREGAPA